MTTELFDIPESLSPKLKWLGTHGLITRYDPELGDCPESPETGNTCYPWIVTQAGVVEFDQFTLGSGRTEEEAIINYCEKTGTPHYSLPNDPL